MKSFNVTIEGISDLLQHRFGESAIIDLEGSSKKKTVQKDHSQEWRDFLYLTPDNLVYQPETHIHGAMVKAAVTEKIPGRRGKTYKDFFQANIFIEPACILHNITLNEFEAAETMVGPISDNHGTKIYIDKRPAVVNRSRVIRFRPAIVRGWKLPFQINCIDDDVQSDVIKKVLDYAGTTIGIGDFRPRFGRFMVTQFAAIEVA